MMWTHGGASKYLDVSLNMNANVNGFTFTCCVYGILALCGLQMWMRMNTHVIFQSFLLQICEGKSKFLLALLQMEQHSYSHSQWSVHWVIQFVIIAFAFAFAFTSASGNMEAAQCGYMLFRVLPHSHLHTDAICSMWMRMQQKLAFKRIVMLP